MYMARAIRIAALALLLAAAVATISGGTADAYIANSLVGNIGQPDGGSSNFSDDQAQAFTTGDSAQGYTLTSATIEFSFGNPEGTTDPSYAVSVNSDSSGQPGPAVGALTNPPSLIEGANAFAASGRGIHMDPETTYWLVVDVAQPGDRMPLIGRTSSDAEDFEDSGDATGWSIADDSARRLSMSGDGPWTSAGFPRRISIAGYANPMVGNMSQEDGAEASLDSAYAQQFATGDHEHGYKLTSVGIAILGIGSADTVPVAVSVRPFPGFEDGTVLDPASSPTDGVSVFAAPGDGIDLTPDTRYVVVVRATNGAGDVRLGTANSPDEDTPAASGWSIEDDALARAQVNSWATTAHPLKIAVSGFAKAAPPTRLPGTTDDGSSSSSTTAPSQTGTSYSQLTKFCRIKSGFCWEQYIDAPPRPNDGPCYLDTFDDPKELGCLNR